MVSNESPITAVPQNSGAGSCTLGFNKNGARIASLELCVASYKLTYL